MKSASFDQNPAQGLEAAGHAESLGLLHEARAWASLVERYSQPDTSMYTQANQIRSRIEPRLASLPLVRCGPLDNPIRSTKIEQFPLPAIPAPGGDSSLKNENLAANNSISNRDLNGHHKNQYSLLQESMSSYFVPLEV